MCRDPSTNLRPLRPPCLDSIDTEAIRHSCGLRVSDPLNTNRGRRHSAMRIGILGMRTLKKDSEDKERILDEGRR